VSVYVPSSMTLPEANKFAGDLGKQDEYRKIISDLADSLATFGYGVFSPEDHDRTVWTFIGTLGIADAEKRELHQQHTAAVNAHRHLKNLEIARTARRYDFLGNEYGIGDIVTWPVGSGSSSSALRIGTVVAFRNNGGVHVQPHHARWGYGYSDIPKVAVSTTAGYIVCVTSLHKAEETQP